MNRATFKKDEKLCSTKLIGELFSSGNSFLAYPLKVVWTEVDQLPGNYPVQISFSVPKRTFKRAVARNLLKRRMREAYRLQKSNLYKFLEVHDKKLAVMLIYIGKEPLTTPRIEKSMSKFLEKIQAKLKKS